MTCTTVPDTQEMANRYINWYHYNFYLSNNLREALY